MIGQGVWILWGVENCHLPLTKPVAVNTGLALPRSPWYLYVHYVAARFMRLSSCHCTDALMEDCFVFDSSAAEIQPDEAVPLLKHTSMLLSHHNFEMASVHKTNHKHCASDSFKVHGLCDSSRFSGINLSLNMDAELCYFHTTSRGKFFNVSIMSLCCCNNC